MPVAKWHVGSWKVRSPVPIHHGNEACDWVESDAFTFVCPKPESCFLDLERYRD